ncbi:MAG TPA: hypothetical protein VNT55_21505 [Baekduia sp.]|nr:hypothetical protein [Baekduia sp.]
MEHAVCCEELTAIGGRRRFDGGCWTLELADAVAGARERRYAFYVLVDGERIDLVVDERADGEPYLRPIDPASEADVLALPRLGSPSRAYARPVSPR